MGGRVGGEGLPQDAKEHSDQNWLVWNRGRTLLPGQEGRQPAPQPPVSAYPGDASKCSHPVQHILRLPCKRHLLLPLQVHRHVPRVGLLPPRGGHLLQRPQQLLPTRVPRVQRSCWHVLDCESRPVLSRLS